MAPSEQTRSRSDAAATPPLAAGDRFRLVMEIFREAIAAPAPDRAGIVHRRAGDDAELRRELEAMLQHDVDPGPPRPGSAEPANPIRTGAGLVIADPTPGVDATDVRAEANGAGLPRLAGHYRIIRVIGEGGMGVVYQAEQTLPRRAVALKAIRSGLVGLQVLRRFAREAHLLGRLAHPGIAQIYEAGVVGDGPADQAYLVMEYVDGRPLTDHAKAGSLTVRERMELVARVCDAVQHAHQRRVIHRDLKPANILVDASGQPKVLDFGVAALSTYGAPGESAHDASLQTLGPHIVGTLAYMPPEQLEPGEEAADTRSDVYSLGVILYEMLAGRLPLRVHDVSFVDAARAIQNERPPRLGALDRALRGDPEIIAAKAIEKDRAARYQSAAELAADLRRCVAGEAIAARAASLGYVLRRAVRRHRVVVSLAAAAIVAIATLGVYAGIAAYRNQRLARELAVQLSDSRIERARLLAHTSQSSAAEEQLWTELGQRADSRLARWALWDLYSRAPCLATLPARDASALDAAFSPDGSIVAVANRPAGSVEIWDSSFTNLLRTIDLSSKRVLALAFSPDGRRLATGDGDGRLRVFDPSGWASIVSRDAHNGAIWRVAYSPDGALIATAGRDGHVRLWSADAAEPIRDLVVDRDQVEAIAFSPDSRTLVSASATFIGVWDMTTGESKKTITPVEGAHSHGTGSLAFSPDGARLYSGGRDRSFKIWDGHTFECLVTRTDVPGYTFSIVPSKDSGAVYIASDGVELRDGADGHLLRSFTAPDGTRRALALAPAEDRLVTASLRGRVSLIETREHPERTILQTGVSPSTYFWPAFSPDATTLAAPFRATTLRLTRAGRWDEHRDLVGSTSLIRCVAFSPDGRLLVSGSHDGEIRVWDVASGATLATAQLSPARSIYQVGVSPDGSTVATGSADGHAALWRLPSLELVHDLDTAHITRPTAILAIAWSPDSQRLSVGTGIPTLGVWRTDDPRPQLTIALEDSQTALCFSPEGRLLLGGEKAITVLDPRTGAVERRLTGQSQQAVGVAFAGDDLLVSASRDRTVRLWDWPSGLPLLTLDVEDRQPGSLAVSSDGRWAACMVEGGEMVVWDLGYYKRHVAGNASWNLGRYAEGASPETRQQLEEQLRREVLPARAGPGGT